VPNSSSPYPLELIAFPGAPNLPVFVAQENGYFDNAGVRVKLSTTPSSGYQAENLINGKFHVGGTAFDNVIAYQEGVGPVALSRDPDLFAFMGATQVELAFVVAPEITRFEDLKGRTLAMDALSTGFAFVLYEMLERNGLTRNDYEMVGVGATPLRWESVRTGKHAGTLTIEPFTSIAKAQGFRVLERSTNLFDCYQGGAFIASHQWAKANPAALKGYIKGYLEGLAWTLAPENRAAATDVLLRNMPEIKPQLADAVMTSLLSAKSGLTPRAEILMKGVEKVLELRARFGGSKKTLNPANYIDLSYYNLVT
jgi:ABC-type nitrate/sulfonate/bicarbonate transport system substrate-binding protein